MSEEAAASVRAEEGGEKSRAVFGLVLVGAFGPDCGAREASSFFFVVAVGKLTFFAVATRANLDPVFANFGLVLGLVDSPLVDDLAGSFAFAGLPALAVGPVLAFGSAPSFFLGPRGFFLIEVQRHCLLGYKGSRFHLKHWRVGFEAAKRLLGDKRAAVDLKCAGGQSVHAWLV